MKHIVKFNEYLKEELINDVSTSNTSSFRSELIKIIGDGNTDALDKFMDDNDIDVNYDSGMILKLASKLGKLDVVKYLSEIGGDFSIRRNLALKTALAYGKTDVAEFILNEHPVSSEDIDSIIEYVETSEESTPAEKSAALKLLANYK